MATPNSMLMDDKWKSTKKAFLISTNASKRQNLNFTNKISKVYTRRVIKNFKGKTVLFMLKRSNEQSENGVNWNLGRNSQTIATISPTSDKIVRYNSQHSSKISETILTDHLNTDDNRSSTAQLLQVQKTLSRQATRSLPNILRPRSARLSYKAQDSEHSQDYQYDIPESLQYNCDGLKHTSREAHQTTATEIKKVYIKKSVNKRKQVHKPLSIKQGSPKWVTEDKRNEETKLEEILDEGNFKETNVTTTFTCSDKNKLRINEVKVNQTVMADQSLDCMLKSAMCMEQEFHSRTMFDQENIECRDFQCTSKQDEINGIQSELCIPNYTDFLGIGNYLADSDEVHKLLHPTLDNYTNNTDSTNSDTNDLDLLISNDCAEQHMETVRKLLPQSIIINNDICGREKANNVIKETASSIENTVLCQKIELPSRSKAQNGSEFACNNNIQNIDNLNVHENLDSQVTTYKIPDDNVLNLKYSLVNNSMTIQDTPDNVIKESGLFLNHKNSHKKKSNKLTTKEASKEKSDKNNRGNAAAYCLTDCTEQFGDGCFHEFKASGVYYAEANTFTNHLNFCKHLITTYDAVSSEEKYKRRSDKIDHIKKLHEAAILPTEPPASLRCTSCSKIYSKRGSFKKHMKLHENFRLTCKRCSKTFREKVDFTRHVDRKCHNANTL